MRQRDSWNRRIRRAVVQAAVLGLCGQQGCVQALQTATTQLETNRIGEPVGLLIQGFNYTDDDIDNFTVNGQGGGNVHLSGPDTAGGGGVCCISYRPGSAHPIKLKIRWVGGYCMQYEISKYGRVDAYPKGLWREADALAVDLSNGKPRALDVHFYPNGRVEAAISDGNAPVRMNRPVDGNGLRPGIQHKYPNCTDDQLKSAGR